MEQIPEAPEFIIALSPRARSVVDNLITAGLDWHVALLQLTCWIEPVVLDIEESEQPESEQAEQAEQAESEPKTKIEPETSQN